MIKQAPMQVINATVGYQEITCECRDCGFNSHGVCLATYVKINDQGICIAKS